MTRLNARDMIDVLVEAGSWASWDVTLPDVGANAFFDRGMTTEAWNSALEHLLT